MWGCEYQRCLRRFEEIINQIVDQAKKVQNHHVAASAGGRVLRRSSYEQSQSLWVDEMHLKDCCPLGLAVLVCLLPRAALPA
jgi:hypothetical protein